LKRIVSVINATRMAGRSREFSGERSISTQGGWLGDGRAGGQGSSLGRIVGDPWLGLSVSV
jgi:hypothetical protein